MFHVQLRQWLMLDRWNGNRESAHQCLLKDNKAICLHLVFKAQDDERRYTAVRYQCIYGLCVPLSWMTLLKKKKKKYCANCLRFAVAAENCTAQLKAGSEKLLLPFFTKFSPNSWCYFWQQITKTTKRTSKPPWPLAWPMFPLSTLNLQKRKDGINVRLH